MPRILHPDHPCARCRVPADALSDTCPNCRYRDDSPDWDRVEPRSLARDLWDDIQHAGPYMLLSASLTATLGAALLDVLL